MERVADLIINMMKAARKAREGKAKLENPMKKGLKRKVAQVLKYGEGASMKINPKRPRRNSSEDEVDYQRQICVRNFSKKV